MLATPRIIIRPIKMTDAEAYFTAEEALMNELAHHIGVG